jgi:hypothetical protein
MAEILGLAAAAEASVELYLRVMRCCWRRELEARIGAARSWRAQHCAAYRQDSDMAGELETEGTAGAGDTEGCRPVRASGVGVGRAMGCAVAAVENPEIFSAVVVRKVYRRATDWLAKPATVRWQRLELQWGPQVQVGQGPSAAP